MDSMKTNNKGLSLVETIIVLAIMSALVAAISIGLSSVVSRPADACAEELVSTLRNAKVTTMGKRSCVLELSQVGEGSEIRMKEITVSAAAGSSKVNNFKLGDKGVLVSITTKSGNTYRLYEIDKLEISFNRETGGFNKGKFTVLVTGTAVEEYISSIEVSKGNRSHVVTLAHLTGKVKLD